jgi:hypothetical protein
MTLALRLQPIQHTLVQADADGLLPRPGIAQPHHSRQLPIGKTRDALEIDPRIVPRRLSHGNASKNLPLAVSQWPVPDIVGLRAFQPRALRLCK